jgi:outer membrane protein assembly factor BamB
MNPLRILLLSALILVVFGSGEADAEKEPLWNYTTGAGLRSVAISADGEYIVAGSQDSNVYLSAKDSSTPLWSYTIDDHVDTVAISADGEYIVAGTGDWKVYLFDKDSNIPLWNYTTGAGLRSVAISADGEYITAGSGKNVYLFSKDSGTPLWSYETGGGVYSVSISADGEYIAAGSQDDNNVLLFDKDSGTPLWTYETENVGFVSSVAISADGEYITAGTMGDDEKVYLFDKDSSTPLWSYDTGDLVYSVTISADGEYIAAGGDTNIYLFNKDGNTPLWVYTATGWSVSISADGEYIVAGSEDHNVYLFYKDSSEPLWSYIVGSNLQTAISFDGEYIAAGGYSNKVYLFDNNMPPTATIDSITPSPAILGDDIIFNGSSSDEDGTIVKYEWLAKGEQDWWFLSDKEDFVYSCCDDAVLWEENYDITFRAYDDDGDWAEDSSLLVFIPNQPPTALIDSISPSPARFDDEITFNGTGSDSDGNVISYKWFSCLSSPDNPSISDCTEWEFELLFLSDLEDFSAQVFYNDDWPGDSAAGTHFILFRVCDDNGGCSEAMTTIIVNPNSPPNVINSIEPNPAEKGTTVFFNGTGSDSDGAIVAYLWESTIDGELSTKANFSSNNLSLGHHTITFQVQDNDGDWVYTNSSLFVFTYPIAIAGQDSTGTPGVPLQFSGAATDEDGTVVLYEWDFDGDGIFEWSSTVNGRELNIYNNEGTYTATLRVTDNEGFTGTDTVEITISEKKIQIDDDGNVIVEDAGEDEEGIPSISLITSLISIGLLAIFRRK